MPAPSLTDLFNNESNKKFAIRGWQAIGAVERPDQISIVDVGDMQVRICSKYVSQAKPPLYLVVIESVRGENCQIDFALKGYPDLCEGFGDLPPLEMVMAVAERFGITIKVGKEEGKFILTTRVPKIEAQDTNLIQILDPKPKEGMIFALSKLEEIDGVDGITLSLCFALDTGKYVAWLKEKSPHLGYG